MCIFLILLDVHIGSFARISLLIHFFKEIKKARWRLMLVIVIVVGQLLLKGLAQAKIIKNSVILF